MAVESAMMRRAAGYVLAALFCTATSASAEPVAYGPFELDAGSIQCGGNGPQQVEKYQTFKAPDQHSFVSNSIDAHAVGGSGATHACAVSDTKLRNISASAGDNEVNLQVITEFTVYAHAACGDTPQADTAAIKCSVSAQTQPDAETQAAVNNLLNRLPALTQ